ncbi:MAG TPA: SRPBCC domain-containing protein [Gemmatimonadales bacterium]|nr:SRPBCC domain-containing protein [Gemmatimonadales bacterium]
MTTPGQPLPPIHKTITVPWSQDRAFQRFTAELGSWWPAHAYSVGQARVRRCALEGRVGGEIYEEWQDGSRHVWGTVQVWDPPSRVAFSWHPGREASTAQSIDVRFSPAGAGTRLDLVHSGWEHYGADAAKAHRGYPLGWTHVLNCWAGRRHHWVNLTMNAIVRVMAVRTRTWLWLALVLLVGNAVGGWIAYGREEMLHGHLHVAATVLSLVWLGWLATRLKGSASAPAPAGRR